MLRERAFAPLAVQHQNALALCVLVDRSLQKDMSPDSVARLAGLVSDRFDGEISNHFEIEETIVFPAVEQEFGPRPELAALAEEHHQIEHIVDGLRSAPGIPLLQQFVTSVRSHIRHEETGLFEEIQQRFPRKLLDEMGARIDAKAVRMPI